MLRYVLRWSNGFWKVFDTFRYRDVERHDLRKNAEQAVERANLRRR